MLGSRVYLSQCIHRLSKVSIAPPMLRRTAAIAGTTMCMHTPRALLRGLLDLVEIGASRERTHSALTYLLGARIAVTYQIDCNHLGWFKSPKHVIGTHHYLSAKWHSRFSHQNQGQPIVRHLRSKQVVVSRQTPSRPCRTPAGNVKFGCGRACGPVPTRGYGSPRIRRSLGWPTRR